MKKIVFILSLVFVAGFSLSSYASQVVIDNDVRVSIVEDIDDKKPCPENCTADCCTKDEAKADNKSTKTDSKCSKTTKSSACAESKECPKSKSTDKSTNTTKTTTEKK